MSLMVCSGEGRGNGEGEGWESCVWERRLGELIQGLFEALGELFEESAGFQMERLLIHRILGAEDMGVFHNDWPQADTVDA